MNEPRIGKCKGRTSGVPANTLTCAFSIWSPPDWPVSRIPLLELHSFGWSYIKACKTLICHLDLKARWNLSGKEVLVLKNQTKKGGQRLGGHTDRESPRT